MRFEIACILILAVVAAVHSQDAAPKKSEIDGRSWFTTFTLILSTSTTTTTSTATTTCTTSTAALSTCSAGRRRRGLFYDENEVQGRARRGLFYNEHEITNEDGSVFLPSVVKREVEAEAAKAEPSAVSVDDSKLIPLTLQSGFSLPEGYPAGPPRFGLAFGTTTLTSTTVTTSTSTLTATCASTTGFATCASGK